MHNVLTLICLLVATASAVPIRIKLPNANGTIVFAEDFEEGNLNQWNVQACPEGVTISSAYARTGNHSAKFTVNDGDTHAKCSSVPTDNPRAQLVSQKGLFTNGDEFYIAVSVFFPPGFPQPKDWFQIAELYGPPFAGSPSMGVDICQGNRICFQRDASHNFDDIWVSSPIVLGKWRDIVLHVKFSTDPSVGFVGIYDDGVQQKMSNGQSLVYYQTLSSVNWNGTPNNLFLNQYRSADENLGTVTLYHDAVKVGTTLESVMPPQ
eukprot:Phypoly_transcript_14528.p1 GENE.Phypoly_transcript_14528~~Phypoly_transcript_14528.p1  ORF type:complete len:264 (+),score=33.70 Phypoly_transcript_14528:55-846(+)